MFEEDIDYRIIEKIEAKASREAMFRSVMILTLLWVSGFYISPLIYEFSGGMVSSQIAFFLLYVSYFFIAYIYLYFKNRIFENILGSIKRRLGSVKLSLGIYF